MPCSVCLPKPLPKVDTDHLPDYVAYGLLKAVYRGMREFYSSPEGQAYRQNRQAEADQRSREGGE